MVAFALGDVGADLGSAVDQSLVLQDAERLANGVAGSREFGGQFVFGGQPLRVDAGVDLLTQHVGGPGGTIGPGALSTRDRYGVGHAVTLMRLGGTSGPLIIVASGGPAHCAGVGLDGDQPKPAAAARSRHFGNDAGFAIPLSKIDHCPGRCQHPQFTAGIQSSLKTRRNDVAGRSLSDE